MLHHPSSEPSRNRAELIARLLGCLIAAALGVSPACLKDSRDLHAARPSRELRPSGVTARSWGMCSLIGPRNGMPGMYGTDLGFTARAEHADKLTILFGDTWARPVDSCQYPVLGSDDLQGWLPVQRPAFLRPGPPPRKDAVACHVLQYPREQSQDTTSWPRLRLFPNSVARSDDAVMDTSSLRTPVAAFSDGQRVFGIFHRNDPVFCDRSAECPSGMNCSTDPGYAGKRVGECGSAIELSADAPPTFCRDDKDCGPTVACNDAKRGVCLASRPFEVSTRQGAAVPTWYHDDPRRGIARTLYIAASIWPDKPADYATVVRFATNRFQNLAARSVAFFDAEHPERNDYRPGYHTLLIWGRASFIELGGAQALPFLLYQPLDGLRGEPDTMHWRPRFYAGYDAHGKPAWSESESDAQPVYGTEASVVQADGPKLKWQEPEFDYVNQMAVSWVAPLRRWVMLYGGDVPAFMVLDPHTGRARDAVNLQWAPGAIHMRTAAHPWGSASAANGVRQGAWSSAEPILTRQAAAPYLACGLGGPEALPGCLDDASPHTTFDTLGELAGLAVTSPGKFADVAASCIGGEAAHGVQNELSGDPIGRLYGPNILDDWTEEVTDGADRARGGRAVELYWNASTWSPYQVVLFKTLLRAR